eukprot:gene10830-14539_t
MDTQDFNSYYEFSQTSFHERYSPISKIGEGAFGKVYQCQRSGDGNSYAIKIIKLTGDIQRKWREVENMRRLDPHPNIITYIECFSDEFRMAIVMEYCPGIDLFEYMHSHRGWKSMNENEAKLVFIQIANALAYIHGKDEIHRDVKPENILVANESDPVTGGIKVKLLDFGWSKYVGEGGELAVSEAGSPLYMAPEIVAIRHGNPGAYGSSVDCWSLGVVMYVILFSSFPQFIENHTKVVLPPITDFRAPNNEFDVRTVWYNILSDPLKDILQRLMKTNSEERLTMQQAFSHPWLNG